MGLSLKVAAERFSNDSFIPWNATTNTFDDLNPINGRLFAADRFTPIYHRPASRKYASLQTANIPTSSIVKRDLTDEIYIVSQILHTEMLQNDRVYDRLRVMHSASNPSGGEAEFYSAAVSGTGVDLGVVTLSTALPCYVDTELHSMTDGRDTQSSTLARYLITHSTNIAPQPGDYFKFNGDYYLVIVTFSDGGFLNTRAVKHPVSYIDAVYSRKTGTGGYDPTTGTVTQPTTNYNFSGIIGNHKSSGLVAGGEPVDRELELFIFFRHIGFDPKIGDKIIYDDREYIIFETNPRVNAQQWHLICKAN